MKILFSNLINISLVLSLFSFIFSKRELGIFLLAFCLLCLLMSLFIVNHKSKKIYFLILTLICSLLFFAYSYNQKRLIEREIVRLENIKIEENRLLQIEKKNNMSVEDEINVLFELIKSNQDKNIIFDKAYEIIAKAKNREDVLVSKSYLDIGKAYEVAALVGIPGASELAFTNYNKYCNLEPKDSTCYITLAKFLLLDKSKNKESLRIIRLAIPLAKDDAEKKMIQDIIDYIKSLK